MAYRSRSLAGNKLGSRYASTRLTLLASVLAGNGPSASTGLTRSQSAVWLMPRNEDAVASGWRHELRVRSVRYRLLGCGRGQVDGGGACVCVCCGSSRLCVTFCGLITLAAM